jgi:protein-L-isoaspartate(D-aspartate) O-methyltransferase
VQVVGGDGSCGYPSLAPYDAISVTAAAPSIPQPLIDQLADGGRLVIPVGRGVEDLVLVERHGDEVERSVITQVRFVPLTGQHGTPG